MYFPAVTTGLPVCQHNENEMITMLSQSPRIIKSQQKERANRNMGKSNGQTSLSWGKAASHSINPSALSGFLLPPALESLSISITISSRAFHFHMSSGALRAILVTIFLHFGQEGPIKRTAFGLFMATQGTRNRNLWESKKSLPAVRLFMALSCMGFYNYSYILFKTFKTAKGTSLNSL